MKHKILYVEDEAFLAKVVMESLGRKGNQVKHLADGIGVVEAFIEYKPDVCVLDIMLPHRNGYELAKEIRQIDKMVPIIFLTAKSQTEDVVTGFDAGGNDYVKKPFSIEELQVRMDNLVNMSRDRAATSKPASEIALGGRFRFHPKKQQLTFEGSQRSLSYKECRILELLCQKINGSTERKEILLKIWNDDSYFNSRNLDVYIRKLRGYLAPDPKIKIITLKGVGYHFFIED